jgi:hypothetical protein
MEKSHTDRGKNRTYDAFDKHRSKGGVDLARWRISAGRDMFRGALPSMNDRQERGEPDAMSVFTHAVNEARELAKLLKNDRRALSVPGKTPDGHDGFQQSMQNLEDAILELKAAISVEASQTKWDDSASGRLQADRRSRG